MTKLKSVKEIEKRLKTKSEALRFEEERGLFPTTRAILEGEIKTLKWVLGVGKLGGRQ